MKIYPDDWRVRLTTSVLAVAFMAAAIILGPMVGITWQERFWTLMLLVIVAIIVGNLLGLVLCRLSFRSSKLEDKGAKKG